VVLTRLLLDAAPQELPGSAVQVQLIAENSGKLLSSTVTPETSLGPELLTIILYVPVKPGV